MPVENFITNSGHFEWLDIVDPLPAELTEISKRYDLHDYTLRDCLQPDHLPKREELENIHFLITRLLTGETEQKADSIQEISNKVAVFYNEKLLITIHRRPQEFIKEIKTKYLDTGKSLTSGEIVTRILWNVLDTYDKPGQQLAKQVDELETKVFLKTVTPALLEDLYYIRRKASVCHKLLSLTSEAVATIETNDAVALQDVKDLHIKLLNMYTLIYEDVTNLLNIYLSISSYRTNDVMKVLTIFSVFFMPLTFIAGIYGMNFEFMPELDKRWGYPGALILMAGTSAFIYFWFKKKNWL